MVFRFLFILFISTILFNCSKDETIYKPQNNINPYKDWDIEYQIHELYNRMVRLWGNLEINDFYNILDQEGYYDLKTRIEITEKMYEDLKRSYGLNWRKVLGSMLNGTDPNLNKRIQNHKRLSKEYGDLFKKK